MTIFKRTSAFILLATTMSLVGCYNDKEEILYPKDTTKDCSNPAVTKGPLFTQVQNIVQSNCVSCHDASGSQSPDLSTACQIVDQWDRIKVRCVDQQDMPTSGPLNATDQQAITNWVNAGHLYTN